MQILDVVLTPVAFADPPLLNVMGVHEPFALRSVVQVKCEDGIVGLGESYGDDAFFGEVHVGSKEASSQFPRLRRQAAASQPSRLSIILRRVFTF